MHLMLQVKGKAPLRGRILAWGLVGLLLLAGCSQQVAPLPLVVETPSAIALAALTAVATEPLIPSRDLNSLAAEFGGAPVLPVSLPVHAVGDVSPFWYKDLGSNSNKRINARLYYRSEILNMWVEEGVRVNEQEITRSGQFIESQIIPTNRALFGHELGPDASSSAQVNILHLQKISGVGIAYFSAADQVSTAVNPYSNQRPMLYVSLQAAAVGSDRYFATIAHELQHMSHWHQDRNEDAWLGEGLSELAVHANSYPTGRESVYAARPDVQLTTLRHEPDVVTAHYAAAFLFAAYFHDRFGDEAVQALVRHPANGAAGFAAVLADMATYLTFDDLFAQWLAANYLSGVGRGEGIYRYESVTLPPLQTSAAARAETSVNQYGADYLRFTGTMPVTLIFTGTQQVGVKAGAQAYSGSYFWLSYPADESDMRLTRSFNLADLEAATLTFWTWYDIEAGWDYGYVAASADGGTSWTLLETTSMTRENPQGNSFGPGFTGRSGSGGKEGSPQWVQEMADLTPFAGQEILLRFQYVTDDAVHLDGWAIDDVAIPELSFLDDAERDDGAWQASGFVRLTPTLPQRFLVKLLMLGADEVKVERLALDERQQGRWTIPLSAATPEAVVIVAGTTPFTRETAVYAYTLLAK
jgi:immune inhibitor A